MRSESEGVKMCFLMSSSNVGSRSRFDSSSKVEPVVNFSLSRERYVPFYKVWTHFSGLKMSSNHLKRGASCFQG